ncbi:hypothetical protein EDB89DRAFT_1953902 [Lactarius sanguifluus]|nr:hypothetical protein EDB89DRAFT_1953902 [Lactarius sanguifluus]
MNPTPVIVVVAIVVISVAIVLTAWHGWDLCGAAALVVASMMACDVPGTLSCEHVQQVHSSLLTTGTDDVVMIGAVATWDILLLVGDIGFYGRMDGSGCGAWSHGSCVAVRESGGSVVDFGSVLWGKNRRETVDSALEWRGR